MTPDILEFLSWGLPGGIMLVPTGIGIWLLIWSVVWKGTKFWDSRQYFRMLVKGSVVIVVSYFVMWFIFRPAPLPQRVLIWSGNPYLENSITPLPIPDSLLTDQDPARRVQPRVYVGDPIVELRSFDWQKCAIHDLLERRIAKSDRELTIQSDDLAPVLKRFNWQGDSLIRLAERLGCLWLIEIRRGEDSLLTVFIHPRRLLSGRWEPVEKFNLKSGNFNITALELVAEVQRRMGEGKGLNHNELKGVGVTDLEKLYRAKMLAKLGAVDSAGVILEKLMQDYPNWKFPFQEFANTYLSNSLKDKTLYVHNALVKAIRIDSLDARSFSLFALYFLEKREWDKAESSLKLAMAHDPQDPRPLFDMTKLNYSRYQDIPYKYPLQILDRVIQMAPGFETARLARAKYYHNTHLYRKAKTLLKKGIEIDSLSTPLLLSHAFSELASAEKNEAMRQFRHIIAIKPGHPEAYYNLGHTFLVDAKYDSAIVAFDSSYANGGSVDNLYMIGLAKERQGKYEEALRYYEKRILYSKGRDDRTALAATDQIRKVRVKMREDGSSVPPNLFPFYGTDSDFKKIQPRTSTPRVNKGD